MVGECLDIRGLLEVELFFVMGIFVFVCGLVGFVDDVRNIVIVFGWYGVLV